ncbi:hypothetical protein, partial [Streptomyces sp. NPDC094049]|uniref:hypothetical protein n=1 Tax=Streptomyces sp. NPDC094049 TaxID=3154987 RepID=UPI0033190E15
MRRHPLLDVVEEIDPQESYTARDVAGLTGASPHTVRKWAAGGHLGAGSWEGIGTDASGAA